MKRLVVLIIVMSSLIGMTKTNAQVAVGVSVGIAPPEIPVYTQPPCPVDGYLWEPGYWAWGDDGYYWVPGVWVLPPTIGFLWTPGYWGWDGGHYWWHGGYWGPHIGFYGGVNYGCGYWGTGFGGGRWVGGRFSYNTAAWRVGGGVRNTYVDRSVVYNGGSRAGFNGPGGVTRQASPEERSAMNEHHVQPTSQQMAHQRSASASRNQLSSRNGGHPSTMARSSVGGQRYNSSGAAMHSAARSNTAHSVAHTNTMHTAPRASVSRPQAQPQHNTMQRGGMQHPAAQPGRPAGGGERMGGGGGAGRMGGGGGSGRGHH